MTAHSLVRLVAPATPLITLDEAKRQLRVTGTDEDTLITSYIATATSYLDAGTGVLGEALVTQTWRYTLSHAPLSTLLPIPLNPVQSIVQIRYVDVAGVTQTYSALNYRLAGAPGNSMVELLDGASWPDVDERTDAFWVEFVAGYGLASAVPETIRQTALLMIAELYTARQASNTGDMKRSLAMSMLMAASRSHRGMI